jgi:hypothetical protein
MISQLLLKGLSNTVSNSTTYLLITQLLHAYYLQAKQKKTAYYLRTINLAAKGSLLVFEQIALQLCANREGELEGRIKLLIRDCNKHLEGHHEFGVLFLSPLAYN